MLICLYLVKGYVSMAAFGIKWKVLLVRTCLSDKVIFPKLECSIFLLKYLNIIISAISPFSNVGSHIYHLNKNTKSNHCKKRDTKQNSNKINKHPVLWTGWRYDSYSSGGDTPPISRWTADHLMIPQANAAHVPKHACPQKSSAPSIPGGTKVVWPAAAMTLHASRC